MKFPHLIAICATLITAFSLVMDPARQAVHPGEVEVTELMHFDTLR